MLQLVLLLSLSQSSFAAVKLPDFMVGQWSQADRSLERDEIDIAADLSIQWTLTRQVGVEGTSIPDPTTCRYRETGVIDSFEEVSTQTTQIYADSGKVTPNYDLGYQVRSVELIPSVGNSPNCPDFIKQQSDEIALGGLYYIFTFKDLTDSVLLEPWSVSVFTKK